MIYSVFVHKQIVTEYVVEASSEEEARVKATTGLYIECNGPGEFVHFVGDRDDYEVYEKEI